jgi:outer membrane protein OmpA-like peptidoglycan-associated protein
MQVPVVAPAGFGFLGEFISAVRKGGRVQGPDQEIKKELSQGSGYNQRRKDKTMKTQLIMTGALALTLVGTGCATKKYVAKTMAPVEARVTSTEAKNADQDKTITAQGQEITSLQTNLSRANELITSVDTKAGNAQRSADSANTAAGAAQRTADGANTAAANAMTAANNGRDQAIARANEVERNVTRQLDAAVTMKLATTETVLFTTNQATLTKEAKEALDSFAASLKGKGRYIVEVQGFTDKTGSAEANTALSQRRAEAVTRYLVNEHDVPLHMVTTLGSGYADPTGDDKTRDGRKQNRRVEVRVFEPQSAGASLAAQN